MAIRKVDLEGGILWNMTIEVHLHHGSEGLGLVGCME